MKLDPEYRHFLSLDRLSMTYSWYNIRSDYKNNTIKYTHDGSTWYTITFTDGVYSYSDINDYIHQYMDQKSLHSTDSKGAKVYSINLTFIPSTYRVLVSLDGRPVTRILCGGVANEAKVDQTTEMYFLLSDPFI